MYRDGVKSKDFDPGYQKKLKCVHIFIDYFYFTENNIYLKGRLNILDIYYFFSLIILFAQPNYSKVLKILFIFISAINERLIIN